MDYGAQIYATASPNTLKMLDPVQNEAMRLTTGAFRTSPVDSLQVESGCPPLDLQREEQCLRFYAKMLALPDRTCITDDSLDDCFRDEPRLQKSTGAFSRSLPGLGAPDFRPFRLGPAREPPWTLGEVNVCEAGVGGQKDAVSHHQLRAHFMQHLETAHSDSAHIYTDGSKTDTGVGFGVVGDLIGSRRGALPPDATVFTAELTAIQVALSLVDGSRNRKWTIYTDSLSSLKAVRQMYPRHPIVQKIQTALVSYQRENIGITFCKVPSHIGVGGNESADRAATEAAQQITRYHTNCIPHRDFRLGIRRRLYAEWQRRWDRADTHLKRVRPSIKPWPELGLANRRAQTIITRMRIGHTRFTHEHYMTRGRPPECPNCRVSANLIQHALEVCPAFHNSRQTHGLTQGYAALLRNS